MATYKGIQGYSVQSLASDPSPAASVEGQLWYNSTSNVWKISAGGAGAWATGNNMNTGKNLMASAVMAPSSAAIIMGGNTGSPELITAAVETYDGSTWTSNPVSMNTARRGCGGIGTVSTAAVVCGGYSIPAGPGPIALVELYNGSTWTEVVNLPAAKTALQPGGAGSSTAGLMYGGGPATATTISWDGTSWTEENDMQVAKSNQARFGTQTAAVSAGGYSTAYINETETWNGTSWTQVNVLNTARANFAGGGTITAGICFGGDEPGAGTVNTETWDGTSWTEVGNLATAIQANSGCATTNAAALSMGGNPGYTDQTEVWDGAPVAAKTVTVS